MTRKTIAAALIALAATALSAGPATADDTTDPGVIITDNSSEWGSHTADPDTGYTAPGVEQCPTIDGAPAVFTSHTPVGTDEDGAPIYADICHYEDLGTADVQL